MEYLPHSIVELIESFRSLPGVGQKTAERYTFHLLRQNKIIAKKLAKNLEEIERGFGLCRVCQNYSENEICPICSDNMREKNKICIVSEPLDIVAFEETGAWRGTYHILHGLIAPLDGVSPHDLKIAELVERVRSGGISEIVLALNTDLTGEATAVYIAGQLADTNVKITRLAQGLPQGGEITYTDSDTLGQALKSRQEF